MDDERLARLKEIAVTHYVGANDTQAAMAKVAPDVLWHGPAGSPPTYESWKARHERLVAAFANMDIAVHNQIAEGDLVVTQWTIKGTHVGSFVGIAPTGKRIVISGIGIDRVANGQIVEHWGMQDMLGVVAQLGGTPSPEGPRLV
jgi:steroid delta-isomerase-like uncharacterized protein